MEFNVVSFIEKYAKLDNNSKIIDSQREYDSIFVHTNELYETKQINKKEKNEIMKFLKEAANNIENFFNPEKKSNIKANTTKIISSTDTFEEIEMYDANGNKSVQTKNIIDKEENLYVLTTIQYDAAGNKIKDTTEYNDDDPWVREQTFSQNPGESTITAKTPEGKVKYETHRVEKEDYILEDTKYPDGKQLLDVSGSNSSSLSIEFDNEGYITRLRTSYIEIGEQHLKFETVSDDGNNRVTLQAQGAVNGQYQTFQCKTKADVDKLVEMLTKE